MQCGCIVFLFAYTMTPYDSLPNQTNECLIYEKQASFDDLHEAKNLKTARNFLFFLSSSVGQ